MTLTEVRPDSEEQLIQSGWLRASQQFTTPGEVVPVRVELFPFAHAFQEGSRVRLIADGPGGNRWR